MAIFRKMPTSGVGKTLRVRPYGCMRRVCVSQSVKLLVYAFCVVHIFLTQRRIKFICGMLMPYNVGNIMRVGMLGSKVIKGVLLNETLR